MLFRIDTQDTPDRIHLYRTWTFGSKIQTYQQMFEHVSELCKIEVDSVAYLIQSLKSKWISFKNETDEYIYHGNGKMKYQMCNISDSEKKRIDSWLVVDSNMIINDIYIDKASKKAITKDMLFAYIETVCKYKFTSTGNTRYIDEIEYENIDVGRFIRFIAKEENISIAMLVHEMVGLHCIHGTPESEYKVFSCEYSFANHRFIELEMHPMERRKYDRHIKENEECKTRKINKIEWGDMGRNSENQRNQKK